MTKKPPKLAKNIPASELFLFSDSVHPSIDTWFKGCVVIESKVSSYNFKKHNQALHAFEITLEMRRLRDERYPKYITTVINYKEKGLAFVTLSGVYTDLVAVHGRTSCADLAVLRKSILECKAAIKSFASNKNHMQKSFDSARMLSGNVQDKEIKIMQENLAKTSNNLHAYYSELISRFKIQFVPKYLD